MVGGSEDEAEDDNTTVKSADKAARVVTKRIVQPEKAENSLRKKKPWKKKPQQAPQQALQ